MQRHKANPRWEKNGFHIRSTIRKLIDDDLLCHSPTLLVPNARRRRSMVPSSACTRIGVRQASRLPSAPSSSCSSRATSSGVPRRNGTIGCAAHSGCLLRSASIAANKPLRGRTRAKDRPRSVYEPNPFCGVQL